MIDLDVRKLSVILLQLWAISYKIEGATGNSGYSNQF